MNFEQTIKNLNRSLAKKQPSSFNHSWIKSRVRKSYNFIVDNITTELGEADWDRVVCRLDYDYQKLWLKGVKRKKKVFLYEDTSEVDAILNKYQNKLYTFLAQIDKEDKRACDEISIRLVRTAQKGNLSARQKAFGFIKQLVGCWIDTEYFQHWRGYDDLLEINIDRCIRRYRYSGSFIVYLRRTLEYSGRALRSLEAYSLDENSPITERRKSESVVKDTETGEILIFGNKH